jgi:hypothetical protein
MIEIRREEYLKKAGIKRGKVRNLNLPRTKVVGWGMNKTLLQIERAMDLLYRKK